MKTLVIFNSHIVTDETLKRFRKLKNDLQHRCDWDIKWCIDTTFNKCIELPSDIPHIKFNIDDIKKIKHIYFDSFKLCPRKNEKEFMWLNGNNYLLLSPNVVHGYDYVWMIEFDACYVGNWDNFFREMDNHKEDLISFNIINIDKDPSWGWPEYIPGSRSGKLPFFKHLGCVCRLSKNGIKKTNEFLVEYNSDNNYYYELLWPTSIVRNNLTYYSMDEYCQTPYWPGVAPLNDIHSGKLYHAVKEHIIWNY